MCGVGGAKSYAILEREKQSSISHSGIENTKPCAVFGKI